MFVFSGAEHNLAEVCAVKKAQFKMFCKQERALNGRASPMCF